MRGLTPEDAIAVDSVRDEYLWLDANYPGHSVLFQRLIFNAGTPMDAVSIMTADGGRVDVFFDISGFFGRPIEPETP